MISFFKSAERAKALMRPLQLEDGRAPGLSKSILMLGSMFVVGAILWGLVTNISELTLAPGQLRPDGFIHSVQHLEGGQIEDIYVSEGQIVEAGMPLVRLQPVQAAADLDQLQARRVALSLRIERLSALVDGRAPRFGQPGSKYARILFDEQEAYETALARYEQERRSLRSKIEQHKAESEMLARQIESLMRQLAIQREQLKLRENLVRNGYVAKTEYLDIQREVEKSDELLILTSGQRAAALEALNEAQIKLLEFEAAFRSSYSEERAKATAELSEVTAISPKQQDRVERLLVRAPVRGVIQELVPKSVGQVLRPGDLIASIVPVDGDIVAEVQVPPQDIGYVKKGQRAEVQVSTFDSARFGKVAGTVRQISATTFQTTEGVPYYKTVIALEHGFVTFAGQKHRLLPGMVVQAEIATGSKSLVAYMLKPIYNNYSTAFSER
ncbi:MAG TPA: HlyD family type I secretion periplasmic adaptor subunit [Aestuariivirgaceae bacterium]|jgi:HlyD family type I secretion membrane fusion protein